jgi:hypothetical protein
MWLIKGPWQLAQRLSLRGRSLRLLPLGLLHEDRAPASVVLLSPIFTLCLSSFHENLPISPLIFKPYSSSLPLPLPLLPLLLEPSSVSLFLASGEEVRTEGLPCMGEPRLNWRRGEGEKRGRAVTGLSVIIMDKGLPIVRGEDEEEAGLADRLGLLEGDEEGEEEAARVLVIVEGEEEEPAPLRLWKKLQLATSITFFTNDSSSLPSHITSLDCLAFRY